MVSESTFIGLVGLIFLLSLIGVLFLRFLSRKLSDAETRIDEEDRVLADIRVDNASLQERLRSKDLQILQLETELEKTREELSAASTKVETSAKDISKLQTLLSEQKKQMEEKLSLLKEAKESMREGFNALANDIFEKKQKEFKESSNEQLKHALDPLQERIKSFEKKVSDEAKERFSLVKEIKNLQDLNSRIAKDALNLTNALKGENKTQGVWGEIVLERVLEKSGLKNGREYETQVSYQNDLGKRFQPDAVVKLPEGKDIIIDSKVSLTHYERFCSADNEDEREEMLKQHIDSIRQHVRQLSGKDYQMLQGVRTVDFVLMFIPVEAAFSAAVGNDPDLYSDAFDKNIGLVAPSTLLATLRMVQNIWRYEKQNKNAMEIGRKAGALYDKFVNFVADLELVGSRLESAQNAYEGAYSKLVSGRGNIVKRAEEMKLLGAKTNKSLPDNLLEMPVAESKDAGTSNEI